MTENHQNKNLCNRVVATTESFNNYKNGSQDFSRANIKSPLGIAKSFNNNQVLATQELFNNKIIGSQNFRRAIIESMLGIAESFNNKKNGSQDFRRAVIESLRRIAKSFNNNENGFQSLVNAEIYSPPGIAESFINRGSGSQILKNLQVECDDTSILSKIKASLPHFKILDLFNYNQDGSQTLPSGWKDYINSLEAGPPRP